MDALAVSETLFGSTMVANFLLVGAAYQSGALPIPERFILDAIEFNGVAVAANVAAFRWGRVAVADPTAFAAATRTAAVAPPTLAPDHPLLRNLTLTGDTAALAARRAAELIDYQGTSVAAEYLRRVQNVWQAERSVGEATAFSEAAARGLFKLAAYKDEYEVARLLTDPAFLETVHAEVPGGANLTYKLHPPTLKALGRDRKVGFGPRSHGVLRILKYGKRLRGTPLDPFGYTTMRRLERTLLAQYQSMLEEAAARLTADTYQRATSLAEAADLVRGYEDVKLRSVERYRARLQELGVDTVAF
jgi:indolepyruvate ferredoxin oxidoreductase